MEINFNNVKNKKENIYLFLTIIAILIIILLSLTFVNFFYSLLTILGFIFYVRILQNKYLGNALKVTNSHFYRIKIITEQLCRKINIKEPDIYITFDPYPNAFTIGFFHPYTIVLTSSLVENLSEDELEVVIAHELGHAYFHHPRISTLFNMMSNQNNLLFNLFYQITLIGFWNRAIEYTADNFSLLLTKNPQAIISALIKLNVSVKYENIVDEEQILNQLKLYKENFFSILGELNETHPYFVKRINNIINFYNKLGKKYFKKSTYIFCMNCGKKIEPNSKFCIFCGEQI